jgi:DNA repair exonuclease SbcCD ATPase subunit
MEQSVSNALKRVDEFAKIEPRLIRNIEDVESRLVKFRQEVNPHEIFKTIKTKAENKVVNEVIENIKNFQAEIKEFKEKSIKDIELLDATLKSIVPIFEELKVMTAARQSKCLVCGNKASNPLFERKVQTDINSLPGLRSLGRNRTVLKNRTQLTESIEFRPKTMDRHNLHLNQSSSNARILIVAKDKYEEYFSSSTCKAKYKLPLSYQVMNERHKEGAVNMSKTFSNN